MLRPESMSRIIIVGSKSRLDDATDALQSLEAVHLIDYFNDSDPGFSIGAPRPYSAKASERLLKVRAVEKELAIDGKKTIYQVSAADVSRQIESGEVEAVEKDVFRVLDERNEVLQTVTELKTKKTELELLSGLPLDLEMYNGYDSIVVFVGTVKADPTAAIAALADSEFFITDDKKLVAIFVKKAQKDEAQRILADFGYADFAVPEGTGSPKDNMKTADESIVKLEAELVRLNKEISDLKEQYEPFLMTTDEELSLTVSKGEIPLRIATSEFSFVMDAWVPTADVQAVKDGMHAKLGETIHVELMEDRTRDLHEVDHAEPRFKNPPTKLNNGRYAQQFEYPTKLVSTPRYQEIDPSVIMAIFFPLFFGFMVGDVGYAIPFIILGAYGLKVAKSKEFKAIATILFFGGLWAFLFGFFFFGEMLGMHFIGAADPLEPTKITWEMLLNVHFPEWFHDLFISGHGISKTGEVALLLKISVYIGIFHLLFSYAIGFANVKMQHGAKEAMYEKGGWMLSFAGMTMLCWGLTQILIDGKDVEGILLYALLMAVVLLIAGIAVTWKKEKAQAILELPGIIGNILSYTRLAAIGMSKAGMALAFNYMAIVMIAGFPGVENILLAVAGCAVFIIGHLMIWVLAIISAGMHGLRLQYVESMNKFFTGGGEEYEPLQIKRKHTKIVETEV